MNTFKIIFQADRIVPYTVTLHREHTNKLKLAQQFSEIISEGNFIYADTGYYVRSSSITSFRVILETSIIDAKEKARKVVENYLKTNGPAITVDSLVYMYQEYYLQGQRIESYAKAAIESNKNELQLLAGVEEEK